MILDKSRLSITGNVSEIEELERLFEHSDIGRVPPYEIKYLTQIHCGPFERLLPTLSEIQSEFLSLEPKKKKYYETSEKIEHSIRSRCWGVPWELRRILFINITKCSLYAINEGTMEWRLEGERGLPVKNSGHPIKLFEYACRNKGLQIEYSYGERDDLPKEQSTYRKFGLFKGNLLENNQYITWTYHRTNEMSYGEFLDKINTGVREDKTGLLKELVKNYGIADYFADSKDLID